MRMMQTMRLWRPPLALDDRSNERAKSNQDGLVERFEVFFRVAGFRRGETRSNSSARRLRRVPRSTMAST
jgi:hypothetical protein